MEIINLYIELLGVRVELNKLAEGLYDSLPMWAKVEMREAHNECGWERCSVSVLGWSYDVGSGFADGDFLPSEPSYYLDMWRDIFLEMGMEAVVSGSVDSSGIRLSLSCGGDFEPLECVGAERIVALLSMHSLVCAYYWSHSCPSVSDLRSVISLFNSDMGGGSLSSLWGRGTGTSSAKWSSACIPSKSSYPLTAGYSGSKVVLAEADVFTDRDGYYSISISNYSAAIRFMEKYRRFVDFVGSANLSNDFGSENYLGNMTMVEGVARIYSCYGVVGPVVSGGSNLSNVINFPGSIISNSKQYTSYPKSFGTGITTFPAPLTSTKLAGFVPTTSIKGVAQNIISYDEMAAFVKGSSKRKITFKGKPSRVN